MSNGNLLDGLSVSQGSILNGLGGLLSGLASADPDPFTSGILNVASVIAKLGAFLSPDPLQSQIDTLRQQLHDTFVELTAIDAASQTLDRKTLFHDIVANISTSVGHIQDSINEPNVYSAGSLIQACQTQLNRFVAKDDWIWNVIYSLADFEKIYWSDYGQNQSICYYLVVGGGFPADSENAGYGPRAPSPNPDGTVFEYRVTLPIYLWAIASFLAVGRALDPNFLNEPDIISDLVKARDTLQWVYADNIMQNGLIPLLPPDWTTLGLRETACPSPVGGGPQPRPALRLNYGVGAQPPPIAGVVIEYGAAEKFSGGSSIGNSYQVDFPSAADMQNRAVFNKLQIRTLKRTKDLYVEIGLLTVWQTINQLNALLGQPAMPKPTFTWQDGSMVDLTDWSFRQIVSLAKLAPTANGYSLRALGALIIGTQPFDTPYSPGATTFSLRQLLTNFSD
jgi:hypothetical protein